MWIYRLESDSFVVQITGGSVRIIDKPTGNLIKAFSGYTYLYTGGIHPDEQTFFALENGKHFYVYSLKNFALVKRVTLPRTYEAMDVCGFYSHDGKILNIPAHRFIGDGHTENGGYYEYVLCKYETGSYTLVEKTGIESITPYGWRKYKNTSDPRSGGFVDTSK